MDTKKELYADGIGQIHFAGGMVRYDFVSMQPAENASTFDVNGRVIMPPQGFLNMFNSMQELIDKLLEAGVLQKNAPQAQAGGMPVVEDAVIIEEEGGEDLADPAPAKKKAAKKTKK